MMMATWPNSWGEYLNDYRERYWEKGTVRRRGDDGCYWDVDTRAKRNLSLKLFGDEFYLDYVAPEVIDRLLARVRDKGVEKATACFRQRREERAKKMEIEKQRWTNLREKFNGIVISMDSKIDVYSDGFSVRVLLNSETSFAERKSFLKENRAEFLKWLMYELSQNVKTSRRIGDIGFYKPVEMTLLRAPEVEVKFEVKVA